MLSSGHGRVVSLQNAPQMVAGSSNPSLTPPNQAMFVQQVRPAQSGLSQTGFHSNQIQMINQNGQIIQQPTTQQPVNQPQPIQNIPQTTQIIDQNGQMIHTVVQPNATNDMARVATQ